MIIITGGAGFIGSNMLAALTARGMYDVVVADRLRDGEKWRNLAKHEARGIVTPEQMFPFLEMYRGYIKIVIHMGAISATTEANGDAILENNFQLSLRLWEWCAAKRVRLIYASSAATYGDGSAGFNDDFTSAEALARLRPLNLYGWSKHMFDRWVWRCLAAGRPSPPQWAGLKFFNVYGPNEYHKGTQASVIAQKFPALARGEPCLLFRSHNPDYPDGGQMRDFVSVEDCTNVMLWLIDTPSVSGLFNLGTGTARTFRDVAEAMFRTLGREPRIQFIDTPVAIRDKYQYFTQAGMEKLRAAGYDKPFLSLEEGIGRYITDFLATGDRYR
ncbi:MAG: ADP-L-glycero-D-manno-heptose 6-epimerase [Rhodospirillaceae bacterium]|nr:MAG: ADP-L-glycero-D-manno-heptose 6-epimerase [Rhodospirillaceae bacterium]